MYLNIIFRTLKILAQKALCLSLHTKLKLVHLFHSTVSIQDEAETKSGFHNSHSNGNGGDIIV